MSEQMNTDRAIKALSSGIFSGDLLEALSGLLPESSSDALELALLRTLVSSPDPKLRNASALALTDINSSIAPFVIRGLIQSPDLHDSLGTLLYALRAMNGNLGLSAIAIAIANASEEAQEEFLTFLQEKLVETFSEYDRVEAKRYLTLTAYDQLDRSRKEVCLDAIDLIDELTNR